MLKIFTMNSHDYRNFDIIFEILASASIAYSLYNVNIGNEKRQIFAQYWQNPRTYVGAIFHASIGPK